MSEPIRLDMPALTAELAKLPLLRSAASTQLLAVQRALAHAVASGQSADQLAGDLRGAEGARKNDLSAKVAVPQAGATPPEWIGEAASAALANEGTTRVVVIDREPTALGGLELPGWARALKPSAVYGPVTTVSSGQLVSPKWVIIFTFTEITQFVRGGEVLCVLPLSILTFGSQTQFSLLSGSAWIAAAPFGTAAPADSFAGMTIKSGAVVCSAPITISNRIATVPVGATLSMHLLPSPLAAGPAGFPASAVVGPKIDVEFPATGTATMTLLTPCSATIYGEAIECDTAQLPVLYNGSLKLLYAQGKCAQTTFKPKNSPGKLIALSGSAPILSAGWAMSVSESTTPATLGTAVSSGDFGMVFGPGISCKWKGSSKPEPIALGSVVAQNNAVLISGLSGSAPGVTLQQTFLLWDDQDATAGSGQRCKLVASRAAGQLLTYALAGTAETLVLGAALQALIDRPLLATGSRVTAQFREASITLTHNNAGNRITVVSSTPLLQLGPNRQEVLYPMALDNALLEVTQPVVLSLTARTDANFNVTDGLFFLFFPYKLLEFYLPDPYTSGAGPNLVNRDAANRDAANQDNASQAASAASAPTSIVTGYLGAEVSWVAPGKVKLRLGDTGHTHPATPPTTEAGSTVITNFHMQPGFGLQPIQPIEPILPIQPVISSASAGPAESQATKPEEIIIHPQPTPPDPLPNAPIGPTLLDVSTRASQLGVQVITNDRYDLLYTIDGLSVRGPANLLPLTTLPAIAWEPMYNQSTGDASVDNNTLLHPPNDGPLTQVRPTGATLIPVSPLQSLQAVLDAPNGVQATLTLPFGMVAFLDNNTDGYESDSVLPTLALTQPLFAATDTPSGEVYTGAWQLSIAAPDPADPDPVLAGTTYLRTQDDNPYSGYSYGEQVLGIDVSTVFSTRFNPLVGNDGGVPLRRYDLTGYGASTFSEWSNITNPAPTDVIKAFFHVLIGRTSHEVIQIQSIVYPWAIKVVRTITIDRKSSGSVERYDSGWQAASDGLFEYPAVTGIKRSDIHSGLISGVINVRNIQQVGLPISTMGSGDIATPPDITPGPMPIAVQPVTFDADVIIQPQHKVVQGGATAKDLRGASHTCVPSTGITGYIGLQYKYHLSLADMAAFPLLALGAGGPIKAQINMGGSNMLLRATDFDATPINDTTPGGGLAIACTVRGLPKLSSDGAWSMASRSQSQTAPVPIGATVSVPVLQVNQSGTSNPLDVFQFADPTDLFRVGNPANPPATLYGYLQSTGTQSNFLSRPLLRVGSDIFTLTDSLNVAHAGALLSGISKFPGISQCLQFLGTELENNLTNQLAGASLATVQNLRLKPNVRKTPLNLINISIAKVDLYFYWQEDDPNPNPEPVSVVISLAQPTDPSWSLDINHVAIGLTIPALSSEPVIWLEGNFHADADTTPGFPQLKVNFAGPLDPLTKFFTVLQDIASVLSPGGGSSAQATPADDDDDSDSPGLDIHFSNGKLSVTDNFTLPNIPLGPGTLDNVSLDIGASLDILALAISFGVSIGTKDAPIHWTVDPLSGTIAIGAGIKNNALDIFILAGIGLGLAIDLGIASGSASITIALSLEINGSQITIMLLLTGQAQVDVLGGLASASISITCGLGLSFPLAIPPPNVTMIGTASVGIHISICWVVNINFSGSWTFQKNVPLHQLT